MVMRVPVATMFQSLHGMYKCCKVTVNRGTISTFQNVVLAWCSNRRTMASQERCCKTLGTANERKDLASKPLTGNTTYGLQHTPQPQPKNTSRKGMTFVGMPRPPLREPEGLNSPKVCHQIHSNHIPKVPSQTRNLACKYSPDFLQRTFIITKGGCCRCCS